MISSKLCDVAIKILSSVYQPKMIWSLINTLLDPLRQSIDINPAAKFVPDTGKKFISMWDTFCIFVEEHLDEGYTSEQLLKLSPLLLRGLNSSNDRIKKRTRSLWINKFAKTPHSISTSLFDALLTNKLPPATSLDLDSNSMEIDENPKENVPSKFCFIFFAELKI